MAELSLVVKIMKRVSQLADTENVKGIRAFKWLVIFMCVMTGIMLKVQGCILFRKQQREIEDEADEVI